MAIPNYIMQTSIVCQYIQKAVNIIQLGAVWKVGDGNIVNFWNDCWLSKLPIKA